jgi:hypothetical protein
VACLLSRAATQLEPSAHIRQRMRERLVPLVSIPGGSRALAVVPRGGLRELVAGAASSRSLIAVASFALGIGAALTLRSGSHVAAASSVTRMSVAPAAVAPASSPEPVMPSTVPASVAPAPSPEPRVARRNAAPRAATLRTAAPVAAVATLPSKPILQLEGELLEKGRIAMVRGDTEGALAAVDEHLARFPGGTLTEEREALRIQALVAADRDPEARLALRGFQRTYPQILATPALKAAIAQ